MTAPTPPHLRTRAQRDDLQRASDPATPPHILAAYTGDLRLAIRRAAANNPSTPRDAVALLRLAGASADLTRIGRAESPLDAEQANRLAALGPWAQQLAAAQPNTPADLLARLSRSPRVAVRALIAQHPDTPPAALTALLLDRDARVRETARHHPAAPAALCERIRLAEQRHTALETAALRALAESGPWGRALAARHPNTGEALLQELAADQDWSVRAALAEHPAATGEMLAPLIELGRADINTRLAQHPNTPPSTLRVLAEAQDTALRLAVAGHPGTPAAALSELIEDGSEPVRHAAMHHANTPPERAAVLRQAEAGDTLPTERLKALAVGGAWARRLAAQHADTPTDSLHRLAADADPFIRELIAKRNAAPALLIHLGSSADLQGHGEPDTELAPQAITEAAALGPWARILVARHPNTPASLLAELAADSQWQARRNTARHPNTADDTLVHLAADASADVRWSLVRRAHLPEAALRRLAHDEHTSIRLEVALHADTPIETVDQLKTDLDAEVRRAAQERASN